MTRSFLVTLLLRSWMELRVLIFLKNRKSIIPIFVSLKYRKSITSINHIYGQFGSNTYCPYFHHGLYILLPQKHSLCESSLPPWRQIFPWFWNIIIQNLSCVDFHDMSEGSESNLTKGDWPYVVIFKVHQQQNLGVSQGPIGKEQTRVNWICSISCLNSFVCTWIDTRAATPKKCEQKWTSPPHWTTAESCIAADLYSWGTGTRMMVVMGGFHPFLT